MPSETVRTVGIVETEVGRFAAAVMDVPKEEFEGGDYWDGATVLCTCGHNHLDGSGRLMDCYYRLLRS